MTTPVVTLADFLLARIAEDEAVARAPMEPYDWPNIVGFITDEFHDAALVNGESLALAFSPARVLAECEAKRRVVELYVQADHGCPDPCHQETVWQIMRLLALPFADHPDYREEWKP